MVQKASRQQPIVITGTDEHGRLSVICPTCHSVGHVDRDGQAVCPVGEAVTGRLREAQQLLDRLGRPDGL